MFRLELGPAAKSDAPFERDPTRQSLAGRRRRNGLIFRQVNVVDFSVEPNPRNDHRVFGQSSRFVRADDGGGAERLDGAEMLDEAVFGRHPFRRQRRTNGDRRQQTLGNVGDDGADDEYLGPML